MSNTPENTSVIETLLKEGIAAARLGEREIARDRLHKVIELDRNNEKAWFWLAAVVETIAERRQCLESVLLINPNNQRAQTLLEQIEQATQLAGSQVASRSRGAMATIAVAGAVLIGAVFFLALSLLGGDDNGDTTDPTSVTDANIAAVVEDATSQPVAPPTATETPAVVATATITFTPRPTLPPLATSTSTPTLAPANTALPIVPAEGIEGRLLVTSGRFFFSAPDYQQIFLVPVNNVEQRVQVAPDIVRAQMMSANPNADRFVTEQFNSGQNNVTLQLINFNGTNSISLNRYWDRPALSEQRTPRWSPVAAEIVFVAKTGFDRQNNLYIVDVSGDLNAPPPEVDPDDPEATLPPPAIMQLTNTEDVDETWPAWSPDGQRVVYVADTALTGFDSIDLRIIDVATRDIYALTTDGLGVIESMPNWGGPDGNQIVYSVINPDGTSDIWIVDASLAVLLEEGPSEPETPPTEEAVEPSDDPVEVVPPDETSEETPTPTPTATLTPTPTPTPTATPTEVPVDVSVVSGSLLIDLGPQDIMPIWSPDGRYIVFSSNKANDANDFDVYVYDFETGNVFLILEQPESREVAFDWFE